MVSTAILGRDLIKGQFTTSQFWTTGEIEVDFTIDTQIIHMADYIINFIIYYCGLINYLNILIIQP